LISATARQTDRGLGITLAQNDSRLDRAPFQLFSPDGEPAAVVTSPRIGITKAVERPWRFSASGSPYVSRPRPAAPRNRPELPGRNPAPGSGRDRRGFFRRSFGRPFFRQDFFFRRFFDRFFRFAPPGTAGAAAFDFFFRHEFFAFVRFFRGFVFRFFVFARFDFFFGFGRGLAFVFLSSWAFSWLSFPPGVLS